MLSFFKIFFTYLITDLIKSVIGGLVLQVLRGRDAVPLEAQGRRVEDAGLGYGGAHGARQTALGYGYRSQGHQAAGIEQQVLGQEPERRTPPARIRKWQHGRR